MFTGEMAKYQIQDRVREAEAARVAESVHRARRNSNGGALGRAVHALVTAARRPARVPRIVSQPSVR